jgi:TIR domain
MPSPALQIFISYAKTGRPLASKLVAMLETEGWKVWWDTSLAIGDDFRNEIMTELFWRDVAADDCALFLWAVDPLLDKAFELIRAWGWRARLGRPDRGRPKQCCSLRSADVRDSFLSLRLGCSSGLCRKLEHCCFLTFEYVSEEHHLPVWKFQRIMMCSRVVLVDLPEDGSRVIDCIRFPAKQPALPTPHLLSKGELRSRKNTDCCPDIFRRSEPTSAGIEVVGGQFVPNLGRT